MSRLYKALQRAEEERGVRLPHTLPTSRFIAGPVPTIADDPPEGAEYERLKVLLAARGSEMKTTLLVSALRGEGVSTVTARLARALAPAASMGVLVIDTDNRDHTVTRRLGARPVAGLAEMLTKEVTRHQAVVASPLIPHVFVLSAGQAALDLANAATLSAFDAIVGELRDGFDHVLIDGGAVHDRAVGTILGPRVDSTLVVVEAERNSMPAVRSAVGDLRGSGARILGVVLNRRREYVPEFLARRVQ
jgi:Mrp family chromosome partitioning ATPase